MTGVWTRPFLKIGMDKYPLTRSASTAPSIALLGVPFDNVTTAETIDLIEQMVASRKPHYLATANVDFLVQAQHDVELRRILMDAHLVLCDGTPLVWASRILGNPLPERVAGSDLVPLLMQIASRKNYRVFFLGGEEQTVRRAVEVLRIKYPDLNIAGHYSPPFATLHEMDHEEIRRRIMEARPDLLFVAFGCPKQEKWISMHYRSLCIPVSVGVGATIDFIAGKVKRAPKWMQKSGLEWVFRLIQEPRRLFKRYANDLWWFGIGIAAQWWEMRSQRKHPLPAQVPPSPMQQTWQRVKIPQRLDIETVRRDTLMCEEAVANSRCCLLELNNVDFIDSTGMGLLIRLQKKARITGRQLILVAPSQAVKSGLKLMRLESFFTVTRDIAEAISLVSEAPAKTVSIQTNYFPSKPALHWRGEITAANADEVWKSTMGYLSNHKDTADPVQIDLSCLQFIDSAGVGLMVRAKKNASKQGVQLKFVGTQPNVRNVLRLARLESVLLGEAA
jgi:N-acetylglucosaminyldiphosphoundecaprenol N-acetyl-beta-D-mannosaminyltransferase